MSFNIFQRPDANYWISTIKFCFFAIVIFVRKPFLQIDLVLKYTTLETLGCQHNLVYKSSRLEHLTGFMNKLEQWVKCQKDTLFYGYLLSPLK